MAAAWIPPGRDLKKEASAEGMWRGARVAAIVAAVQLVELRQQAPVIVLRSSGSAQSGRHCREEKE